MVSSNKGRTVKGRGSRAAAWLASGVVCASSTLHCSDNYYTTHTTIIESPPATGGSAGDTGSPGDAGAAGAPTGAGGAPVEPPEVDDLLIGAPEVDTPLGLHQIDLFGAAEHRFWFVANEEQLERMNEGLQGGFPVFEQVGDIYQPGGDSSTFVDHLFITAHDKTANYGKTEVRLIGQSTARPWTKRSLPNLRVDANRYNRNLTFGGTEHIRFNNGLVGSIFRERITLELYTALGYPVPRSTFAWVGSNVWGPRIWVPYTLVEVYKEPLCERWADALGGGCVNMWEFYGDLGYGGLQRGDSCQLRECDNQRALEFESLVLMTPHGDGFKSALEDWLDWDSFHRFQCLSWALATGDDALHNQNNVLLVERADGLFQFLPYSVDISLGQEWYPDVPLPGWNTVANGCQSDPSCWADTVASCEDTIDDFASVDPVGIADAVHETLEQAGMLRDGDAGRFEEIRAWLEGRADFLAIELENYRESPNYCEAPLVQCNDGYCRLPEECPIDCDWPGVGGGPALDPIPLEPGPGGAGGAPGEEPCPPIEYYALRQR